MGLYDRDYAHEPPQGVQLSLPYSITNRIILLTVGCYVLQWFLGLPFTEKFVLYSHWYNQPWNAYRLLTYGFLHDPNSIWHIAFNMLALWSFGNQVERVYGRERFCWLYLTAIIISGIIWSLSEATMARAQGVVLGASGGVVAVVILFALKFPHAKGMIFPIPIPIPMWILAVGLVLLDLQGAVSRAGQIAFTAHLGGAIYGWFFYLTGWTLGSWLGPLFGGLPKVKKPSLRVHEPDEEEATEVEVDRVLRKIQEQGQASLTWRERRILEKASREYQNRRNL